MPDLNSVSVVAKFPNILNRPIRMGTFGDSTSRLASWTTTSTILPISPSPSTTQGNAIASDRPQHQRLGDVLWVADAGINGENTTQMLDRSSVVSSTTRKSIIDCINQKIDVLLLHAGSINDRSIIATTTGNEAVILAQIERHFAIAKMFVDAGILVLDSGIFGYDDGEISADLLQARRNWIVQLNQAIKTESAKYDNWVFIDVDNQLSVAGAFKAGMSDDGIHLNAQGQTVLSALEMNEINKRFKANINYQVVNDSLYRFKNPSSNIPLGYSLANKGSCTFSGQTTTSKEFAFTVTASANNASFAIRVPYESIITALPIASGKVLFAKARVKSSVVNCFVSFRYDEYNADNVGRVIHGQLLESFNGDEKLLKMQYVVSSAFASKGTSSEWNILFSGLPIGTHTFTLLPDLLFLVD